MRGALGAFPSPLYISGCIVGYTVADLFDFYAQIKVYLAVPIIFFIAFLYFPEAPEYLLRKNKLEVCLYFLLKVS